MERTDISFTSRYKTVACVALTGAAATGAYAQATIYDNMPGDVTTGSGPAVSGPTALLGRVDKAAPFSTGNAAYDHLVVTAPFGHLAGGSVVTLQLVGDSGGLPNDADLLAAGSATVSVEWPSIGNLSWTLPSTVSLKPHTTYWISAQASDKTYLAWGLAFNHDKGYANRVGTPVGPWQSVIDLPLALRVTGQSVSPEPASLALTSLGLVALGVVARKRRQR